MKNQINEKPTLTVTALAAMLKTLGDPTRLRIFQFLRACCCPVAVDEETHEVRPVSGPTVGDVCCHITGNERVTSTVSEHLKDLRVAGLIVMERRGKHVICAVNPAGMEALAAFVGEVPPCPDERPGAAENEKCC